MKAIDQLCINTIRFLSIDAIQKANSGHPGLPMGAAPMAYALWHHVLKHSPKNPQWADRDRFVLSAGHGSMLLYSLLHLTGYKLSLDDIKNFRQWGSITPGHPEYGLTPGVECTTGPLGQGMSNAVGMAMAERSLAARFNRKDFELFDHFTYCLAGDGDLMEGVTAEAASLAGHLKLGKLICLYDSNDISLDGPTDMTFTENVGKRFESYGWQVLEVKDGDQDLDGILQALDKAKKQSQQPSLIIIKTTIGFGSPNKQGTSGVHGSPLGEDEVKLTRKSLSWNYEQSFSIPDEALEVFRSAVGTGEERFQKWQKLFDDYRKSHPELAQELEQCLKGQLPKGWDQWNLAHKPGDKIATRKASSEALNQLAKRINMLIGGDADLSCSTGTLIKEGGDFDGQSGHGRNVRYGVREHAMAAIANGMAYHGGVLPFVATFFCFSDYMKPAIRLAALNHLPVIYVWTHDSVGLGEDGPTHQPIEHLAALRALPNMLMIRPADALESAEAWKVATAYRKGPVGLVFSRQNLPVLDYEKLDSHPNSLVKGAYVLSKESGPLRLILLASGSEVSLALEAQKLIQEKGMGTRVVSMPCWELFSQQDQSYQDWVLPPHMHARISIEAGSTLGWSRWIGPKGFALGLDRFGASAPDQKIWQELGFTAESIAQIALKRFFA